MPGKVEEESSTKTSENEKKIISKEEREAIIRGNRFDNEYEIDEKYITTFAYR